LPEVNDDINSGIIPQRAILTDGGKRTVVFDRNSKVNIRSAGFPKDYRR